MLQFVQTVNGYLADYILIILLIGTGTIAGIIKASALQSDANAVINIMGGIGQMVGFVVGLHHLHAATSCPTLRGLPAGALYD